MKTDEYLHGDASLRQTGDSYAAAQSFSQSLGRSAPGRSAQLLFVLLLHSQHFNANARRKYKMKYDKIVGSQKKNTQPTRTIFFLSNFNYLVVMKLPK